MHELVGGQSRLQALFTKLLKNQLDRQRRPAGKKTKNNGG